LVDERIGGRRIQLKPPEQVVAELRLLRDLGISRIQITDDTFTLNHTHAEAICNLLEASGLDIEMDVLTRVDLVDGKLLKLMYRAGIRGIIFGIESSDENTLRAMNKGGKLADYKSVARDAVTKAIDTGFRVHPIFMLGWPGDTWENVAATVDFAVQIGQNELSQPFESFPTPHPGSEFWRRAKQLGLEMLTYDLTKYTHLCPVAIPNSLGGLNGLERLVEAHNSIHVATGMTYRTPVLDMTYIRSYIDIGDPQRENLWFNIDKAL
jgi:radical SAM superfamily enzyme YgiQ (UPF0313 family)